jgi:sulfite reductase alpha subunit-like flavoprotein
MDSTRSLLILYATETGTAQDAADRTARECRRIHFTSRVISMHAYDLVRHFSSLPVKSCCAQQFKQSKLISEKLVVFMVATTGSGVEPRSMTLLWNMLLRSDLPTDLFDEMEFAVFGLGDTAYEKFCWPAKKLCRRMQSLGATEICARGEGDEQHHLGYVTIPAGTRNLTVIIY